MGGKPEAIAIPKQRGKAMRNTKKPDVRSFLSSAVESDDLDVNILMNLLEYC